MPIILDKNMKNNHITISVAMSKILWIYEVYGRAVFL